MRNNHRGVPGIRTLSTALAVSAQLLLLAGAGTAAARVTSPGQLSSIHSNTKPEQRFAVWLPAVLQTSLPAQHKPVGHFTSDLGGVNALAIHGDGNVAYAAQGDRITVMDISDLRRPREIKRAEIGPESQGGLVRQLKVAGGRLYASMGKGGLYLLDVSRPTDPVYLGRLEDAIGRFAVAGDVVVATSRSVCDVQPCSSSVVTIDVAIPSRPKVLDTLSGNGICGFTDVDLNGARAYVSADICGLFVLDIHDPGDITLDFGAYCDCIMDASHVRIANGMVFLANQDGPSVSVFAADRLDDEAIGRFGWPIEFADGAVWEPNYWGAVEIDDSNLLLAGYFDRRGGPAREDSYGLWIVSVADPRTPTVTGIVETGVPTSLAVSRAAILVGGDDGVSIVLPETE